jgi:hypothetical protein
LDNLTLSNVGLVITDQDLALSSAALPLEEYEFYRDVYQAENFEFKLKPGINLIAAIPAEDLEPDHPLVFVMDALGIEQGTLLLQGTLGKSLTLIGAPGAGGADVIKDLYLRAELPAMRPPGSPEWFRSGQLALELTGDPSVRLVGEMTVNIKGDELLFFLAATLAKSGVSLSGGLKAEEPWVAPFGIGWLTLNKVILAVGVTPPGSVQLGFAGDMVLGEKDIDVAIALAISPAGVPTNFIIKGESEEGVEFADLVSLQQKMAAARAAVAEALGAPSTPTVAIPLDALPDMALKDLGLQFAPKAAPEIEVEQGMKLKGELWLPLSADGEMTEFAGVDVGLTEDGLWMKGNLAAFELGPLVWDDAILDLTATRDEQHFLLQGEVELFGTRQMLDVSLTREAFSFKSETNLFDVFTADISAESVFDLKRPAFKVDAVMQSDFGEVVGPLFQDGIVRFASTAADIVAAAQAASEQAELALGNSEAGVDELRRVLELRRAAAEAAVAVARQRVTVAQRAMNDAWSTRNAALRAWRSTPRREVRLKARRRAAYVRAHGVYLSRAGAYSAARAALGAQLAVLNAIPPVDQSVLVMAAEAAVAELRKRLEAMQERLAVIEAQLTAISEAVARGEQLVTIQRAEFHADLQAAMNGEAIQWDIVGSFIGDQFEVHEGLDFSNVGAATAQIVEGLLRR